MTKEQTGKDTPKIYCALGSIRVVVDVDTKAIQEAIKESKKKFDKIYKAVEKTQISVRKFQDSYNEKIADDQRAI